tara:strand:+ start:822 stop:1076 length:255 start_codon:yes stop_codon:yes gene_type:complete
MAYVVLSHLQDKQPYTCDKCGVGFDYEDYVRNAYCCKKNAKQVETWYKEKDGTGEYRCMMKSDTWKAKGNKTYHYCFDCADVNK